MGKPDFPHRDQEIDDVRGKLLYQCRNILPCSWSDGQFSSANIKNKTIKCIHLCMHIITCFEDDLTTIQYSFDVSNNLRVVWNYCSLSSFIFPLYSRADFWTTEDHSKFPHPFHFHPSYPVICLHTQLTSASKGCCL